MWNPQWACLPTHKTLPGVSLIWFSESYHSWVSFDLTLQVMEFLRCALLVFLLNSRLHTLTSLDGLSHSRSHRSGLLCIWYLSWISAGSGKGSRKQLLQRVVLRTHPLLRTTKFLCKINYVSWHLLYLRWKLNFKGKICEHTEHRWHVEPSELWIPHAGVSDQLTAHLQTNES